LKLLSVGVGVGVGGPAGPGGGPGRLAELPAVAGGSACPQAFYPTTESSAVNEGAVR
jgi:hypothetical protein